MQRKMSARDDHGFRIEDLDIEIACPSCGNEMVKDPNSLPLAESADGAMLECGSCSEISEWRFEGHPPKAVRVPLKWDGQI